MDPNQGYSLHTYSPRGPWPCCSPGGSPMWEEANSAFQTHPLDSLLTGWCLVPAVMGPQDSGLIRAARWEIELLIGCKLEPHSPASLQCQQPGAAEPVYLSRRKKHPAPRPTTLVRMGTWRLPPCPGAELKLMPFSGEWL